MQYESILLELMSRIKKLEDEVAQLKEMMDTSGVPQVNTDGAQSSGPYTKMTEQMIDQCYICGKQAHANQGANLWALADGISGKTGMNRSSAFIYIGVVKSMLDGTVYKRAINAKAMRKYFTLIFSEYGKPGLARAIHATRLHTEYRKSLGHPVDSIESLCGEFQTKL